MTYAYGLASRAAASSTPLTGAARIQPSVSGREVDGLISLTWAMRLPWARGGTRLHVATLVVSPSTPPGTRSPVLFNHFGLLRTTEELLGLPPPRLGHAGDPSTASMRAAFGL